jgi:hypothetical protein
MDVPAFAGSDRPTASILQTPCKAVGDLLATLGKWNFCSIQYQMVLAHGFAGLFFIVRKDVVVS